MTRSKARVAIIYDGFPHYRKGVIEELAASENCTYYFFGDAGYRESSILPYQFRPEHNVVCTHSWSLGPFIFQGGILGNLVKRRITHCVFLGNPRFLSYWFLTPLLRLMGKRVYFWSHGWLAQHESLLKRVFKNCFFGLPNGLLLYGSRAKQIAISRGFPAQTMHVIHNSLDYAAQKDIFAGLAGVTQSALREQLELPAAARIIICTARITRKCRFDLLIRAAHRLRSRHLDLYLLIIGEGPDMDSLAELAASLSVPCRFWGACYDEALIARLYKASDLTVSPGKVGLTAIHSMAYGTPVISHDNLDHQMPEYESIVPGVTGQFFAENSPDSLADVIEGWFRDHPLKPERECVGRVEAEFTPAFQRRVIEDALLGLAVGHS
ncbi:MAG: glycosyltransferase [Steroidobacteraceae bacterium]